VTERHVAPEYLPFVDGPFRWRLGLRPLDLHDWIEIDEHHAAELARRAELMAAHPSTVLVALDDAGPETTELRDLVVDHVLGRFPHVYGRPDPHGPIIVSGVDEPVHVRPGSGSGDGDGDGDPTEMIATAGRLVQEDLVLLVERRGELVVGAGCVCFPNRWHLSSKLGRTMREVHAPVARLNEQLAEPVDGFLARLRPERPFWRLGWGVLDTDERYQPLDATAPPRPGVPDADAPDGLDRSFLRVERETLRRLPRTGAVLFTIRTYIRPLRSLVGRPDEMQRLAGALRALPDDVADYKQLVDLGPMAARWLESAAKES
jgi:dimethylamine monooxygenase subunit A